MELFYKTQKHNIQQNRYKEHLKNRGHKLHACQSIYESLTENSFLCIMVKHPQWHCMMQIIIYFWNSLKCTMIKKRERHKYLLSGPQTYNHIKGSCMLIRCLTMGLRQAKANRFQIFYSKIAEVHRILLMQSANVNM